METAVIIVLISIVSIIGLMLTAIVLTAWLDPDQTDNGRWY